MTAAGAIGDAARCAAIPEPYCHGMQAFSVIYGVPVIGFAGFWLVLAGALTVRELRRGMPFGMTWWAFTFPFGTCVTGVAMLARHTGLHAMTWLAGTLYAILFLFWAVVATRTVIGVHRGDIFLPA